MKYKWLLHLYPKAWRQRYEEEFLALIEQQRLSVLDFMDILLSALDTRFYYDITLCQLIDLKRVRYMLNKLRSTYLKGLATFLIFLFPGLMLYGIVDDSPFVPIMRTHVAFKFAFNGVAFGYMLTCLAITTGGLLVLYDVYKWSIAKKRKDILALFVIPIITFLILAALIVSLGVYGHQVLPGWVLGGIFQLIILLFLAVSGICLYTALLRSEIESRDLILFGKKFKQPYRMGISVAPIAVLGMIISTVSAITWGMIANSYTPYEMKNSSLGIFGLNTMLSWVLIIALMAISTIASSIIASRGRRYSLE